MSPLQFLKYLWALPNTLLALPFLLIAVLGRGRIKRQGSTIEVESKAIASLLTRLVPLKGGAQAITLGHIILGQNSHCLSRCRGHERVHVQQYERWGPFFLPAYFLSSMFVFLRGKNLYLDNHFEVEARTKSNEL